MVNTFSPFSVCRQVAVRGSWGLLAGQEFFAAFVESAQFKRSEPDSIHSIIDRFESQRLAREDLAHEDPCASPVDLPVAAYLAPPVGRRVLDRRQPRRKKPRRRLIHARRRTFVPTLGAVALRCTRDRSAGWRAAAPGGSPWAARPCVVRTSDENVPGVRWCSASPAGCVRPRCRA